MLVVGHQDIMRALKYVGGLQIQRSTHRTDDFAVVVDVFRVGHDGRDFRSRIQHGYHVLQQTWGQNVVRSGPTKILIGTLDPFEYAAMVPENAAVLGRPEVADARIVLRIAGADVG